MESQLFDSDRELWGKISAGDAEAFEEWYRISGPRLRAFVKRLGGSEQPTEDIVQDTFIQIWRHPKGFDPQKGSLRAYLFGTARKVALTWHRRHKTTDELHADPQASGCIETKSMLREALDRLDPEARTILWLREVEGHSYLELAEILSIPVGTVRSRLYASREALRAVWKNQQHPTGVPK